MSSSPAAFGRFDYLSIARVQALRQQHPSGHLCPTCGEVSERFQSGGAFQKRKNARCPKCGSLERHRLFWLHFVSVVWPRLPQGKKNVLHIAPEPVFERLLRPHEQVNYISGDLSMPTVMLKLDLTDMQFREKQFDVVICSHVLEHIPDDRAAMRELFRVVKPGGFLLVMVPLRGETTYEDASITAPEQRAAHFGQDDHVRFYGKDIATRLAAVGFSVNRWPTATEPARSVLEFIAAARQTVFECERPE